MLELQGKVAFITGGASGIGLGQAKVLAEEAGMKVVIADVQQKRLEEASEYFRTKNAHVQVMHLDARVVVWPRFVTRRTSVVTSAG